MKIGMYLEPSPQWGAIKPNDLEHGGRGLGGRETCLIYISRHLAEFGHRVDVFATENTTHEPAERLTWYPYGRVYSPHLRGYDAAVSFTGPEVFVSRGLPAKVRILEEQCAHLPMGQVDALIDAYFVLSKWQAWHLNWIDPALDLEKVVVIPNGIDMRRYQAPAENGRHPHRVFYSSSPDRGLHHLLEGWPLVRAAIPDAELWVFYEVDRWLPLQEWDMSERGRRALIIRQLRDQAGIRFWGMVDPWTLAERQQECTLWAYPAELLLGTETFCITGLEAAAAGCALLASVADCLPEIYGEVAALADLPIDADAFAEGVIDMLKEPGLAQRFTPGRAFAERYEWRTVARRWEREIYNLLNAGNQAPAAE